MFLPLPLFGLLFLLPNPVESFGLGVDRLRAFQGHKNGAIISGVHGGLRDVGGDDDVIEELYFHGAVVDNFAAEEEQKPWHSGQRYFTNKKWWGGNGSPIFLMIGGEGPESKNSVSDAWYYYELAREHKALLVCLEHRFYGKSYPTPDMSTANLRGLLSSAQALADLARFTHFFKDQMSAPDSHIIAFGGSYPGNLAAWVRLKYPHLVVGAVASSAPVRAKADFFEYMSVVGQAIRYFGDDSCFDALTEAVTTTSLLVSTAQGRRQLQKDFDLCGALESDKDVWVFETNVMGNMQGTVQYNAEKAGSITVSDVCAVMASGGEEEEDPYARFVELNRKYFKTSDERCMEVSWDKTIAELSSPVFDGTSASRQWYYQTCNEFGYYQTVSGSDHPFASFAPFITLPSYLALCSEVFGMEGEPPTRWTNDFYGGLSIDATRVLFPSGTIDPWHALGVQNTTLLANGMEAPLYIQGTAHCADMRRPNADTDPPSLTYARSVIAKYVASWVKEGGSATPPSSSSPPPAASTSPLRVHDDQGEEPLLSSSPLLTEAGDDGDDGNGGGSGTSWSWGNTKLISVPVMLVAASMVLLLTVVISVLAMMLRRRRARESEEEEGQRFMRESLLTSI